MTITARRAATREKLLDGAAGVIVRKGVGAATVEDICEEAGFTRGAFYSNFDSKDELLIALLDHHAQRINDMTRRVIDQAEQADECTSIEGLISRAVQEFVTSGVVEPWLVILLTELQTHAVREPEIREAFTRVRVAGQQAKAAMITSALAGRQLRLSVDGETAMQVVEGAANKFMLDRLSEGLEPDPQGLARVVTQVLSGLMVGA